MYESLLHCASAVLIPARLLACVTAHVQTEFLDIQYTRCLGARACSACRVIRALNATQLSRKYFRNARQLGFSRHLGHLGRQPCRSACTGMHVSTKSRSHPSRRSIFYYNFYQVCVDCTHIYSLQYFISCY